MMYPRTVQVEVTLIGYRLSECRIQDSEGWENQAVGSLSYPRRTQGQTQATVHSHLFLWPLPVLSSCRLCREAGQAEL